MLPCTLKGDPKPISVPPLDPNVAPASVERVKQMSLPGRNCARRGAVDRANHVAPLSVEWNATTMEQLDPELPLATTIITPRSKRAAACTAPRRLNLCLLAT